MPRFDIGTDIKKPTTVPATVGAFLAKADDPATGRTCAELADLLEQHLRGELKKEEYKELKSNLKLQLSFYTPHAHFTQGYKAGDKGPVDSGKALLDIDDFSEGPALYDRFIKGRERDLGVNAAYVTASNNGFAVLLDIPEGLTRQQAMAWMAHVLGDVKYDTGVHDVTRAAFIPARDHFCYLDEELMFGDEVHPAKLSEEEIQHWQQQQEVKSSQAAVNAKEQPIAPAEATSRTLYAFDESLKMLGMSQDTLNSEGVRHNTLKLLLPTLCQMMTKEELLGVLAIRMPEYSREQDCLSLVSDFYDKYVDAARPMTQKQRDLFLRSLKVASAAGNDGSSEQSSVMLMIDRKSLPQALQASLRPYPDSFIMPLLTGLMPVLMSLADGVTVRYCNSKIHHLASMAIIMAEQSSNKSVVSDAVKQWIKNLRSEDELVRMKEDLARAKNLRRKASERGEEAPAEVVRVVPVTISCSKLLKRLKQSQGHTLYSICEEIDTLRKTNSAGAWAAKYDIYRVAFDHARWGQDYNSDQAESGEVEVAYNWTIMGTPGSVGKCFKGDNVENGLSSRVMLSEMPDNMFAKMPVFKEMNEADIKRIELAVDTMRKAKGFFDTPRLRKAIGNWVEEKRVEAALAMDRVKDLYRRRAAVIGFRCGVVYMLLAGRESNACLDFACKMAEYTLQQQVKFFGPLLIRQFKMDAEEVLSETVNGNIYNQLPSPFNFSDLRRMKGSEYTDNCLYTMISRWKKEGWIEKDGKSSWVKLRSQ